MEQYTFELTATQLRKLSNIVASKMLKSNGDPIPELTELFALLDKAEGKLYDNSEVILKIKPE